MDSVFCHCKFRFEFFNVELAWKRFVGLLQKFCNPFFDNRSFQIIFGVDAGLLGNKYAYRAFQQLIVGVRWFQIMLDLTADLADIVIQMFDDMEHIDADDSLGKDFPCNRDEAFVHVTAVKADLCPVARTI